MILPVALLALALGAQTRFAAVVGWDRMSSIDSTGTRIWYEPSSARFFEFGTTGPGAVTSPSRRTLTGTQARRYLSLDVLGGWRPDPRVR